MLFNSLIFIYGFLPFFLVVWWSVARWPIRVRLVLLTLFSYWFYCYFHPLYGVLMFVSSFIDYYCVWRMASSPAKARRKYMALSIITNLGILGLFKYYNFFIENVMLALQQLGIEPHLAFVSILLPAGISFYTFQSMSYTIDFYRGTIKRPAGFWTFMAYVSFFPQLMAGPIVRFKDLEGQLENLPSRPDWEMIKDGIYYFVMGLFKMTVFATVAGMVVNKVYDSIPTPTSAQIWFATFCFAAQIYFDFSGYSDMARGLARLLGIYLPVNFNSPYKATSPRDFWHRWHISLSSWLRDYLFIPLGGSQGKHLQTLRNLMITMFLGGLWHGANWCFVIWGVYHGLLLIGHRLIAGLWRIKIPVFVARFMTFFFVLMGWVVFRLGTVTKFSQLPRARYLFTTMFTELPRVLSNVGAGLMDSKSLYITLLGFAVMLFFPNTDELPRRTGYSWAIVTALVFFFAVTRTFREVPFIYFQF